MRRLIICLSFILLISLTINIKAGTYSGGTGVPNDPYLISTAADIAEIGTHIEDWNDCFLLTADINLIDYNETNFNIIGSDSNAFTGVFNGNGHAISNFTWNSAGSYHVGLFSYIDGVNAEIKDLRLIDPNVRGYWFVGALVGRLGNGTITGCCVEGGALSAVGGDIGGLVGRNEGTITNCYAASSVSGWDSIGGLVGISWYGTISNSYAINSVSGTERVGGLVGISCYGTISNCYATGTVTGDGSVGALIGENNGTISKCYAIGTVFGDGYVGGLSGLNYQGTLSNCYATGSISGIYFIGGLTGYNLYSTISNCYATGTITGGSDFGGLVGFNDNAGIFASFWDVNTSGEANGVGYNWEGTVEVYGKTTAEMQTQSTFSSYGWNFIETWGIEDNQTYPFLRLSYPVGDIDLDKDVDFSDFANFAEHWLEEGKP